jgi:hypothetical protein
MLKCKKCDRPIWIQNKPDASGKLIWSAHCVNNCQNNWEDYKEEFAQILGLQKVVGNIEIK